MHKGSEVIDNRIYMDELADIDAWLGYEFWSAQLEAEISTGPEQISGAGLDYLEQRGMESDVLPF
ncbi:MAG TPA: hypothetical protein VF747_10360 [Blastocatellia bacterium]